MSQLHPERQSAAPHPSSWAVGWAAFAGIMMFVQGTWWMIAGFIALVNNDFYAVTEQYVFRFDTTTWGWIHLLVGLVLLAAGLGVFTGAVWARTVGVLVATMAMVVAFAWLPWYPIFALLFIVVSGFVIWSLTAHGRDIAGTV